MSNNFPPYRENRYESWLTESYHGDSRPHAVTQHLSDPTAPELSMVVETYMYQDATTSSGSEQGSALADDEHFIRKSEEEVGKEPDGRILFIWDVIVKLLYGAGCWVYPKPKWWLRIIEGDDNEDDDLWLWVDGDKEWLTKQDILHWEGLSPKDVLSAQSALRRRIARKQYPPVTRRNAKRLFTLMWLMAPRKMPKFSKSKRCLQH
ncbi:hypothetical protein EDD15DRAFT_2490069 [Pisolithus albus]|nr:hypothetical protein EDD15DRAFT_2490069 [Pisolithus albus]